MRVLSARIQLIILSFCSLSSASIIMSTEDGEAEPLTPRRGRKSPEDGLEIEELVLDNPRTTTPQNQNAEMEMKEVKKETPGDGGKSGVEKDEIITNTRTESPEDQAEKKRKEADQTVLAEETNGG